uniref:F-box domain-containing protein n=1 Tax=Ananas comosus var. bracteatus TaxID=296719 RepID=A0A6V7PMB9_ANACO|nr:unnamed protein product [Ananas comosus var. bracteatus]
MKPRSETTTEEEAAAAALIPGLPEDVAELCLVRVPFPYQTLARSVSAAWNRALSRPSFLSRARSSSSSSSPFLFVFAFHPVSLRLQCQALDPVSRRWFLLPQIPLPSSPPPPLPLLPWRRRRWRPSSSSSAAPPRLLRLRLPPLPRRALRPRAAPRRAPPRLPRRHQLLDPRRRRGRRAGALPCAGAVAGRILAASGDGAAARYDPEADRWEPAPGLRRGMSRYDAAVVAGRRMYVTEGWAWPFDAAPRGAVFDADRDAWAEMPPGCARGGRARAPSSATTGSSSWPSTATAASSPTTPPATPGAGSPARRPTGPSPPFAVAGDRSGRIFVVGRGLDVAVATVLPSPPPPRRGWSGRW